MYQKQQNFRSFKGGPRNFSRPSTGRNFSNPSRFSGNNQRHVMRFLPSDPNLYISKATVDQTQEYIPQNTFESFNLNPTLKSNIDKKGYTIVTPIQDQAIQPILEGKDLIGLAATGTGKTAAFLIPLIQKMFLDMHYPRDCRFKNCLQ